MSAPTPLPATSAAAPGSSRRDAVANLRSALRGRLTGRGSIGAGQPSQAGASTPEHAEARSDDDVRMPQRFDRTSMSASSGFGSSSDSLNAYVRTLSVSRLQSLDMSAKSSLAELHAHLDAQITHLMLANGEVRKRMRATSPEPLLLMADIGNTRSLARELHDFKKRLPPAGTETTGRILRLTPSAELQHTGDRHVEELQLDDVIAVCEAYDERVATCLAQVRQNRRILSGAWTGD